MKSINVRLDYDLYRELVEIRDGLGVPVSESLRRAVREYVAKQQKKGVIHDRDTNAAINILNQTTAGVAESYAGGDMSSVVEHSAPEIQTLG